jgi:CheY-like chemotaxis protein
MVESVLNDRRILAVDDEPDILDTLEEQLSEFGGLHLDRAITYEDGYHLLRSWTYDLVILDIMGVRGFDLLSASVQLGFPTVMLTAHAMNVDALKTSIELGARAFLPKEKLVEIVPFLEDVLTLSNLPGWRRVFERLGDVFDGVFGSGWKAKEKDFWDRIISGRPIQEPVILKK